MTKTAQATKAKKTKEVGEPSATMTVTEMPKRKPGRPATKPKVEKKPGKLGRPVDPESKRQKEETEKMFKRAKGELKKGRKADPNSKRQQELAAKEAKRAEGVLKKGRPKMDPTLKEQLAKERKAKRIAENAAKQSAIDEMVKANEMAKLIETESVTEPVME